MRKVAVITGTRAEYGLLYPLMKEIKADKDLKLVTIVTGMHLSPEFGLTYKDIEKDGFKIDKKIEILLSSDTPVAISKSMGLALGSFAESYAELKPDLIVVLGDRFEIFSAVTAAMVSRIPIAHIGGGDSSEGVIDEAMRYSITKMAHLHFTITEAHRKRVIQLGEDPKRVFNVGAPGLENIRNEKLLKKTDLERTIRFRFGPRNLLVTFHPCTLEASSAQEQFQNLLDVLGGLKTTKIIFTKPNADTDGRVIIKMIDDYVAKHSEKSISFVSMGRLSYLSSMQFVDAVMGNSSSGIVEAPSFKIGTVNIGDRQRARIRAASVIDCAPTKPALRAALRKLYSREFQRKLKSVKNPYEKKGVAKRIKEIIKKFHLGGILKKSFYNASIGK